MLREIGITGWEQRAHHVRELAAKVAVHLSAIDRSPDVAAFPFSNAEGNITPERFVLGLKKGFLGRHRDPELQRLANRAIQEVESTLRQAA